MSKRSHRGRNAVELPPIMLDDQKKEKETKDVLSEDERMRYPTLHTSGMQSWVKYAYFLHTSGQKLT